ncbi:MAG: histidine kinase dimerization/phosphoacceptor domain -containing protein [Bacteroidota bacterium]
MSIFPSAAKGNKPTDSVEQLVRSNPAKVVELLANRTQMPNALPADLLLLSKAYLYQGRYYVVDSLIENVFKQSSFIHDSATYYAFLGVEAENKKILEMYDESLAGLKRILAYTQRKGDTLELLEIYLKFAEYYRATNNYDHGFRYLNKVNELGMQMSGGFPMVIKGRMMNRKAALYHEKGTHLDSVELLSKAVIQLATRYNNPNLVASSSNELGFLYLNQQNSAAETCFKNAIAIWDKLGYNNSAHGARINLGRYYLKVKKPNEAIRLALLSIKVTREFGWRWDECYWNEILSVAYEQLHDYKRALLYLNTAKEGLLQLSNTRYKERLAYYSNKLELNSKEEELRRRNKEMDQVQHEMLNKAEENRFLFYLLSIALVILLCSTIFLVITGKQKRQLSIQKEEIGTINNKLQRLVNQKEILLKEVNHRVKNNLSVLAGLMYLKEKELRDEPAIQIVRDMQGRINTISLIHETLYQRDDVEHVNFQEYLERLVSQILALYPDRQRVSILLECDDFNPELSYAMPLSMMMNELITNSFKHAFKDESHPEIRISYNKINHELTYTDNGPGYDLETVGSSLGQKLVRILATQIDAEIHSEWEQNKLNVKIRLTQQH